MITQAFVTVASASGKNPKSLDGLNSSIQSKPIQTLEKETPMSGHSEVITHESVSQKRDQK